MIFAWITLFIIALAVLVKASDWFTDAAEKIGAHLRVPPFIIGVTIVALGTSLPELISSVIAVLQDAPEIVLGNVVGSNIANILLVLGIAAIVAKRLEVVRELDHVDMPIFIGTTFMFVGMLLDGAFTIFDSLLCLSLLVVYILYTLHSETAHPDWEIKKEMIGEVEHERKLSRSTILMLLGSGILIYAGARYTIEAVIQLAEIFEIGAEIIAISAVALGTSLPEVAVTYSAARRGKPEIAIGNIIGSNIFNALAVTGIAALFGPLFVPQSIFVLGLPILVLTTLLYYFITRDKDVTNWEGWMLIIFYIFFLGALFGAN